MEGGVIRQQKNTILKNVNIDIASGEFVYLIGKVGSGKSSFLKTLYAELPLEYGKAEVAGFQLKKIKKSQIPLLRRKCGIVFQDFKLLIDRNVYENLEFVLKATGWKNKKAIRERIETVLTKVGMSDKQAKMPHQLSGGEQQRIVLARALLNAPPLILADEPTGNLDEENSAKIGKLIGRLRGDLGIAFQQVFARHARLARRAARRNDIRSARKILLDIARPRDVHPFERAVIKLLGHAFERGSVRVIQADVRRKAHHQRRLGHVRADHTGRAHDREFVVCQKFHN